MDLQRRLTLYLFGLIIGGGAAYWFYGERLTSGAWMPEAKLKQRLASTLLKATPSAQVQLDARSITLSGIRHRMDSAQIDFSASRRGPDSLIYAVSAPFNGQYLRLRISAMRDFDRDSTATLLDLR
ncbi:MAG: hypothetical protein IPK70_04705 [Flavobacteriales bacterium]|jgi:hypothetical protein|nr:hypothetical protein [Flavobacteriales bacterium]